MCDKTESIKEQISNGDLAINIRPPESYIKSLVFDAMIPVQKTYMKAAIFSFCLSCEHCEYCAVKASSKKCERFHRFQESYLKQIQDTIL